MNKLKKLLTIFLIFGSLITLFRYNYILNYSVNNAVNLWLNKIFPSLFIMFVINDLIINTRAFNPLFKYISPLFNKVFHTDGNAAEAFFLSIFSGTPTNTFIIKEMLHNQEISLNTANKLISFTFFSNPLFLYNILNLSFNKFITFKIILIHYLTNIGIGLIGRKKEPNNIKMNDKSKENISNLFALLPKAISKSLNTMLLILGTLTFYMIITNLFIKIIPLSSTGTIIFKGFLEITQALSIIPNSNISSILKEIMAISIISFGGISIHTQVLALIEGTNISYKEFLKGRIWHVLISANAYLFIYILLGI